MFSLYWKCIHRDVNKGLHGRQGRPASKVNQYILSLDQSARESLECIFYVYFNVINTLLSNVSVCPFQRTSTPRLASTRTIVPTFHVTPPSFWNAYSVNAHAHIVSDLLLIVNKLRFECEKSPRQVK